MDQKKAAELAPLSETVMAPDVTNPDSTILELDELWFFVANKTNHAWDLDRFVQKEPKSWSPMPLEIAAKPPAAVGGGHSTCLRYRSLLHRFLESVSGRDPRRAADGCRQGNRGNGARWNAGTLRSDNAWLADDA